MREHLFMFAVCTMAVHAAETQYYACPPAWPRDGERFKQQTIHFLPGSPLLITEADQKIAQVANFLKAHPSTAVMVDGGCKAGSQGYNVPWLDEGGPSVVAGAMVSAGKGLHEGALMACAAAVSDDSGHFAKAGKKNRGAEFVQLRHYVAA